MMTEPTNKQKEALKWHLENNIENSTPDNIKKMKERILSDPAALKNIVYTHEDHLNSEARSNELRQKLAVQFGIGSQAGRTI